MRHSALGFALLLVCATALGFDVRKTETALDSKTLALPQLAANYDAARVSLYLDDPLWKSWNQANGGNWTAQYDTLTGRPRRVFGGAVRWISPGASNAELERVAREFIGANVTLLGVGNDRLRFVPEAASASSDGRVRYAVFDYAINGVPVEHARLIFAVNNGNLIYWHSANIADVPAATTPAVSASQALASVLAHAGVSAANATVVHEPTLKLLPRNRAAGELLTYQLAYETAFRLPGGHSTWAAFVDATTGAVIAFGDSNRYAAACEPKTSGTGKVTGGVRPAQATDAEVVRSFPFTAIDGSSASNGNGNFPFTGGTLSSGLNGAYFDTNCVDCVKSESDPQSAFQPFVSSSNGRLAFGAGGRDVVTPGQPTIAYGNGTSTPADRTAFFHTNVARSIALKWLDLPWLQSKVGVNVNINDVCNAFWNGSSLNFFKSGEIAGTNPYKCKNTGEIRDVMQHEWGHGLDDNDGMPPGYAAALGLGDMATGEAAADYIALFVDHDSCVGQSFYNRFSGPFITDPDTMGLATCDGVRNVDELRATRGTLTVQNVTQKCPGPPIVPSAPTYALYIGPLLREGHCEGEIWGQIGWHLANGFMTGRQYGTATLDANKQHVTYAGNPLPAGPDGSANAALDRDAAWTVLERLYFASRPIVASYAPSRHQAMGPSAYDGFFIVDDEGDGLANGTPHGAYINDAYVHHGAEEWGLPNGVPAYGDAKNCDTPATPSVTLAQSISDSTPSVTVSWTAVAGAQSYSVLRNERRNDVFLEVGRVTGTSFTDAGVDNGVTYNYRVQVNSGSACFATSANGVKSITVAQPDAHVRSIAVTDSPGGNNDGRLDAGEKAQLFIVVGNGGLAGLTNVTATLSSITSGVSVTKAGPRSYGTIATGGAAGPSQSFAVQLEPSAALCGTTARLILNVSSDQGCFALAVTLPVGSAGSSCVVYKSAYAQPTSVALTSDRLGMCGDGDNVPDPGETVQITVAVNNPGDRTANGVSVKLTSNKSYMTIAGSTVDLGTLAPMSAETKTATFAVSVGALAPHGDTATFTATVTSSGGGSAVSKSMSTVVNRDKVLRTQSYDFETGDQGWTVSNLVNGWKRGVAPTTGNLTTVFASGYTKDRCDYLTSPTLEFSPTSNFAFDIAYVTEYDGLGYDGADVQVSIDGGATWTSVDVTQGYPALHAGTTSCMAKDAPMFAGAGPLMTRFDVDLGAFAGHTGQVRFRFVSDPLVDVSAAGAWVDNVAARDVVVSVPSTPCR